LLIEETLVKPQSSLLPVFLIVLQLSDRPNLNIIDALNNQNIDQKWLFHSQKVIKFGKKYYSPLAININFLYYKINLPIFAS
jgi:hypothetical protein